MLKRIWIHAKAMIGERLPVFVETYRFVRNRRRLSFPARDTPMGFKLSGNPNMQDGSFEPEEVRIFGSLIDQADIFVNVGANIGYYCCHALSRGKHTVAFEPIDENLGFLYKNVKANGWENDIEVFPIALGHAAGLVDIYGGGTGASLIEGWAGTPPGRRRTVPVSTIDFVLGDRFVGKQLLVLVDIEGAEWQMLTGAGRVLDREPGPIWMIEIAADIHQPKGTLVNPHLYSTFQVFWDHGYSAWSADRSLGLVTPSDVQAASCGNTSALPTHNFLFLKRGTEQRFLSCLR